MFLYDIYFQWLWLENQLYDPAIIRPLISSNEYECFSICVLKKQQKLLKKTKHL